MRVSVKCDDQISIPLPPPARRFDLWKSSPTATGDTVTEYPAQFSPIPTWFCCLLYTPRPLPLPARKTANGLQLLRHWRTRMPPYRDEPRAVRVYTVCDESRYLIVRNVPALGCGNDLLKLFAKYGDVEECKPMDAEDCEPFTDVYWIKFHQISNARFAKKKLDEFVFMGNQLQVLYAPSFESIEDTKEKLERRRKEVIARLNLHKSRGPPAQNPGISNEAALLANPAGTDSVSHQLTIKQRDLRELEPISHTNEAPITRVSANKDYFASHSMNQTVQLVREKLDKIQASSEHLQGGPSLKKARVANRRRI